MFLLHQATATIPCAVPLPHSSMPPEKASHTDEKYIKALLKNDVSLIAEIYQKYAPKIIQFVQKNSGTLEDAKDLIQEALMDVYKQAHKENFKLTCPFDAYFYFVCRNKWFNILRTKKRKGVIITDLETYKGKEVAASLAEEVAIEHQRERLFTEMLGQLGQSCQNILKLCWQGQKLANIATELGISYGYTRKKKSECMAKLMQLVKAHPSYTYLKG